MNIVCLRFLDSTFGMSNFADVFIVGKCIFQKSLGPGVCSCNPTSLLLDSRLQSTVLLFGTVSLYVCVN